MRVWSKGRREDGPERKRKVEEREDGDKGKEKRGEKG